MKDVLIWPEAGKIRRSGTLRRARGTRKIHKKFRVSKKSISPHTSTSLSVTSNYLTGIRLSGVEAFHYFLDTLRNLLH